MEYEDQVDLIQEYIEEALSFLDEYNGMLLQLEQSLYGEPEANLVADILGQLHTFKGNSGMMGFSSIQKYIHKLEDFFKALQSGFLAWDEESAELVRQSERTLLEAVRSIAPEKPQDPDLNGEIGALDSYIGQKRQGSTSTSKQRHLSNDKALSNAINKTNVIKVNFERLDHLMNLMGELVIHRTRLGRVDAQVREVIGEKGVSLDLTDASEQIGKVTTELHEAIMKVRMLPLKNVLLRFRRMVKDLARERGKEIDLQFEGEDTELDKTVIDEIGEPLLHLLRNAIDHGIEKPSERLAKGKPASGNILIRAFQESSHIIIIIEDDGRGIDEKRIGEKAVQSGMLSSDDAKQRKMSELIFMPGLSTADTVTEVSGRGLGMEVVKNSMARINGTIEVESEMDSGTRFIIKLPLTLAIISALMVEVSGEQYAIPLANVVESIKMSGSDIHLVNNREVTTVRDSILPLLRLSDAFNLPRSANGKNNYAVVVQSAAGQMGLFVDSLMGQQEIVIKAIDDYLGDSIGIAGATILGDGKVVLIVDVLEVMEDARKKGVHTQITEAQYA